MHETVKRMPQAMNTLTGKATPTATRTYHATKTLGMTLLLWLCALTAHGQSLREEMEAWGKQNDSLYHASVWKAEDDTVIMRGWTPVEETTTETAALGKVPTRWNLKFLLTIVEKDGHRHVDFVPETVERRMVERKNGAPQERVAWQSVKQYCGIDSAEWNERINGQQRVIDSLLARPRTQLSLKEAQSMERQIRQQRRWMTTLQQQRDRYLKAASRRQESIDKIGRNLREAIGKEPAEP